MQSSLFIYRHSLLLQYSLLFCSFPYSAYTFSSLCNSSPQLYIFFLQGYNSLHLFILVWPTVFWTLIFSVLFILTPDSYHSPFRLSPLALVPLFNQLTSLYSLSSISVSHSQFSSPFTLLIFVQFHVFPSVYYFESFNFLLFLFQHFLLILFTFLSHLSFFQFLTFPSPFSSQKSPSLSLQ